jgi:DNA-directed RNA polymerase subunit K/omega
VLFVDIEKIIKREDIRGKFRLNRILSLRARQIIRADEETLPPQVDRGTKPTTKALYELAEDKLKVQKIEN